MMLNRRGTTRRSGATVVETAVVLLMVTILVMAIFEYGRVMMVREIVDNAAREGARQAVAGSSVYSTAQIQQIVFDRLAGQRLLTNAGQPLAPSDIQVYWANPANGQPMSPDSTWTNAPFGQTIAVKVPARFKPMLPTFGFLPTTIPMTSMAMAQTEGN
ncbi:MAG: TadE/TadG family type IV pilus assembly protein [Gemmataceae bacterium]